jgi:hypothetical protein
MAVQDRTRCALIDERAELGVPAPRMAAAHYRYVAAVLRAATDAERDPFGAALLAEEFADALEATNDRFDREAFLTAAMPSFPPPGWTPRAEVRA